ncbi:hypothetical protein [Thiolapillus sp.]|uniref:hypothetical protein n=1 Tax=Thiolapillus sp. TaxID=2017437 RepID=UPI0025DC3B6E|nr:hypothetical protein [Thiolapillus sp.]
MTRTAGARIGCQRPSRFWGLGCPKIYHEAEDTLATDRQCQEGNTDRQCLFRTHARDHRDPARGGETLRCHHPADQQSPDQ